MKRFDCGTLVPGCDWHSQATSEAELVRRASEHLRTAHGESHIRPKMVDEIKSRIKETERA